MAKQDRSRDIVNRVMASRHAGGFHVRVTNIPGRDTPFDYYPANEAQRDDMIRRAKANGYSAEIV